MNIKNISIKKSILALLLIACIGPQTDLCAVLQAPAVQLPPVPQAPAVPASKAAGISGWAYGTFACGLLSLIGGTGWLYNAKQIKNLTQELKQRLQEGTFSLEEYKALKELVDSHRTWEWLWGALGMTSLGGTLLCGYNWTKQSHTPPTPTTPVRPITIQRPPPLRVVVPQPPAAPAAFLKDVQDACLLDCAQIIQEERKKNPTKKYPQTIEELAEKYQSAKLLNQLICYESEAVIRELNMKLHKATKKNRTPKKVLRKLNLYLSRYAVHIFTNELRTSDADKRQILAKKVIEAQKNIRETIHKKEIDKQVSEKFKKHKKKTVLRTTHLDIIDPDALKELYNNNTLETMSIILAILRQPID